MGSIFDESEWDLFDTNLRRKIMDIKAKEESGSKFQE